MDEAGAPVNGDTKVALAPFTIGSLQPGQVLDVNTDKAEVADIELTPPPFGPVQQCPAACQYCTGDGNAAPAAVARAPDVPWRPIGAGPCAACPRRRTGRNPRGGCP